MLWSSAEPRCNSSVVFASKSIEIRGHMTGEVIAEGVVVIHKTGSLDGDVTAQALSQSKKAECFPDNS